MTKVSGKGLTVCVITMLFGALLLCFEATAFLLPFAITLMSISGVGIVAFGTCWLFAKTGCL